jgi:hypothetical protein
MYQVWKEVGLEQSCNSQEGYPDTHSNADYDWDTNSDSDTITKFNSIWNNVTCANQFAEYTNANGR